MPGPDRVPGVRIVVRPALAPSRHRPRRMRRGIWRGVSRLANREIRSLVGWGIRSVARDGIGRLAGGGIVGLTGGGIRRLAGHGGVALVRVVGRQVGRTALQGTAMRRMAVGMVQAGVLRCPTSRVAVTRGMARIWALRRLARRAGRMRRWRTVQTQAVASPAWGRGGGNVWLDGVNGIVGVMLMLAGGCPVRAASLPRPVLFRLFIAVAHTNSTAQPLLRGPEEAFNKLLRQATVRSCLLDAGRNRNTAFRIREPEAPPVRLITTRPGTRRSASPLARPGPGAVPGPVPFRGRRWRLRPGSLRPAAGPGEDDGCGRR
jgi:hypothetical protein